MEVQRAVIGRKRHKTSIKMVGITGLSFYRDITADYLADTRPLKPIRIGTAKAKKGTNDSRSQ